MKVMKPKTKYVLYFSQISIFSSLPLAAHPCGRPGHGRISLKNKKSEQPESGDQRKEIFEEIYEKSIW